jgi:hypothetical protein
MSRSVKLCGCGEHRSPEMALMASTQSEPISYRRLLASATMSFSRTPGLSASKMSWYYHGRAILGHGERREHRTVA